MRILIQGINFAPEWIGIGKYSGEFAAFLVEKGHAVRVVTALPYYPQWQVYEGYANWRYRREIWKGIEVTRCPLWLPHRPTGIQRLIHLTSYALFSFPAMLIQSFWRPDIIFSVAPAISSAPGAILVARFSSANSWLHVQDFELDAAFALNLLPGKSKIRNIAKWFESVVLKNFDLVSTISGSMLDQLIEKGVCPSRSCLLLNWVDIDEIFPLSQPSPLRGELGFSTDQIILLYSGNMGHKQGLETLVDVARSLVDKEEIKFILCGEGAARKELECQAFGLPNVIFLPLQPPSKLNALLNLADIHVLPQRADAADLVMPSKLSGMLASGRPVIATAHQGTELAQVVSKVGRVVPPEDPRTLAEAILELAEDADLRNQLAELGRNFVKESWSKAIVLDGVLSRLEDIKNDRQGKNATHTRNN